jgi:DnaJ-class molecular chaperone
MRKQKDQTYAEESKMFTVVVRPGLKQGCKFTFENEGDESINKSPGNVVITVSEKKHSRFIRSDNDLVLQKNFTRIRVCSRTDDWQDISCPITGFES